MLERLHSNVWVLASAPRFAGVEVGARMTVLRLADGRLVVHSPIAASGELQAEVSALRPVDTLIAPNKLHHLFLGDWQQSFPATTTRSLLLASKRKLDRTVRSKLSSLMLKSGSEIFGKRD